MWLRPYSSPRSSDGARRARGSRVRVLGRDIGPHLTGASPPYDMTAADQFESMVGKRMSLMEFSLPWAYCNTDPCSFIPTPTNQMEAIRQRGSIPVFGWASYSQPKSIDQPDFALAKITGGTYDKYIREWAQAARAWGHPFFLQFDWEMNLNGIWPYSESVNGNRPGDFVGMAPRSRHLPPRGRNECHLDLVRQHWSRAARFP